MIDDKGNPVSVKTYPYIGGGSDYIHFRGDDSWWVKERTCKPIRRGTIISCGACGSELHEPFRFCGGCGSRVVGE